MQTIKSVERLLIENALLHAREAIRREPVWRKYHPKTNRHKNNPYEWCQAGWAHIYRQGRHNDLIRILRGLVPENDLTAWWQEGKTRKDMLALFDQAIASLPALEVV